MTVPSQQHEAPLGQPAVCSPKHQAVRHLQALPVLVRGKGGANGQGARHAHHQGGQEGSRPHWVVGHWLHGCKMGARSVAVLCLRRSLADDGGSGGGGGQQLGPVQVASPWRVWRLPQAAQVEGMSCKPQPSRWRKLGTLSSPRYDGDAIG